MRSSHVPTAHIDLNCIRDNYRLLTTITDKRLAGLAGQESSVLLPSAGNRSERVLFAWPSLMAVVKADAYGHGHIRVASALARAGARLFASGSVDEAMQLRQGLSEVCSGRKGCEEGALAPIFSLLGVMRPEDVHAAAYYGIIPVLHSVEQLAMLTCAERPLAVALKCNTGMARLGFGPEDLPELVERLKKLPCVEPVLALSHLASADSENGQTQTHRQIKIFSRMLKALRLSWPSLAASLCNSAGTLLDAACTESLGYHICRPGIALYGGNPFYGTSLASLGQGLKPVMAVSAPILAVRDVKAGTGVGYGHTFIAKKNMRIGIVAVGYADGFARTLSNKGEVCVAGVRVPVVGRVSMQMTALDFSSVPEASPALFKNKGPKREEHTREGRDQAWLLGGPHEKAISVNELAATWGSIPYEVCCLLGNNTRHYL